METMANSFKFQFVSIHTIVATEDGRVSMSTYIVLNNKTEAASPSGASFFAR